MRETINIVIPSSIISFHGIPGLFRHHDPIANTVFLGLLLKMTPTSGVRLLPRHCSKPRYHYHFLSRRQANFDLFGITYHQSFSIMGGILVALVGYMLC